MKKSLIIPVLFMAMCIFIGCNLFINNNISGTYSSLRSFVPVVGLEAVFNSDHSFTYKNGDFPEIITGTWQTKKDTLFLYAEEFKIEPVSIEEFVDFMIANPDATDLPPLSNGQYTSAKGMDVYLIRGKELYPIRRDGFAKDRSLRRLK